MRSWLQILQACRYGQRVRPGEIRGTNQFTFTDLRRHGGAVGTPRGQLPAHPHGQLPAHCRAHMCAQEKFLQLVEEEELGRRDVPNRGLCMAAHNFQTLEGGLRKTAKNIVRAAADVRRDEHRELLRTCTGACLSIDGRANL